MDNSKLFIGPEAEGPSRGIQTLFIPKGASDNIRFWELINIIESHNIMRFYFGAGNRTGATDRDVQFMRFISDHWPMCPILLEISSPDINSLKVPNTLMDKIEVIYVVNHLNDCPITISHFKLVTKKSLTWQKVNRQLYINSLNDPLYNKDKEI